MGFIANIFGKPKAPKIPDPVKTAQAQQQYNLATAQQQYQYNLQLAQQQQQYQLQQAAAQHQYNLDALRTNISANRLDQSTPFMDVKYSQTGTDQYGNPTYTANTTYTPEQQALLEQLQQNQTGLGQFGESLISDLASNPIYNQGIPDFTSMADPLMQRQLAIMNPYYQQQFNKLDSDLRNQGLTPGTPAYDNAIRTLRQTQNESMGQFANQSIQSVMAQYEQPFNVIRSIMGATQPMAMQNLGLQTPPVAALNAPNVGATTIGGVAIGPTNFSNIQQANLEAQMKQYEAQYKQYADSINAIGGIMGTVFGAPAGTLLGGIGGSIGGGLASMLGLQTPSSGQMPLFRP